MANLFFDNAFFDDGSGTARTYGYIMNNSSGNYSVGNHTWEVDSYSDNYAFDNSGYRQCFISQDSAWRKRLQHVSNTGIAGIGIWALGYDDGYTELWDAMNDYLTDCYEDPCLGTIHDFGGPTRNYYDDEDYTWTIAPPGATSIDIDFTMFDVELNWDYLYIYDGPDEFSPQIAGSPFTGTMGPGQFTTSGGEVTFRFISDGATVTPGFLANYQCNTIPAPVAAFSASTSEICLADSVELISTSSDADSYLWTTSSGGLSSTTADTTYLYPSASGTYNVTLQVTNTTGTDQVTNPVSVTVYQSPIANVTLSSNSVAIPNAVVYFTNTSSNGLDYYWDFGDGNTSTDSNPWHEYTTNGVFDGYLVCMNGICPNDTVFFEITVGTTHILEMNDFEIVVAPNPVNEYLTITSAEELDIIRLVDLTGKTIITDWVLSNDVYSADLSGIASGTYILIAETNNAEYRVKVIKQ